MSICLHCGSENLTPIKQYSKFLICNDCHETAFYPDYVPEKSTLEDVDNKAPYVIIKRDFNPDCI